MKNFKFLLILGIGLTFFSCSKNNDENAPVLDQIFQLKVSETATFSDVNLVITANRVVEDNRCPVDAICIVAGWITVSFDFNVEDTVFPLELTLNPERPQDAETEAGEYTVRLVTVNPHPPTSEVIAPEDYSFSLVVEK